MTLGFRRDFFPGKHDKDAVVRTQMNNFFDVERVDSFIVLLSEHSLCPGWRTKREILVLHKAGEALPYTYRQYYNTLNQEGITVINGFMRAEPLHFNVLKTVCSRSSAYIRC